MNAGSDRDRDCRPASGINRVRTEIRKRIEAGTLWPGAPLPIDALRRAHRVNRLAARDALEELEKEGVVVSEGEDRNRRWRVAGAERDVSADTIAASLRRRIRSGEIPPGRRLKPRQFVVDEADEEDAHRALLLLVGEGIVDRSGTGKETVFRVARNQRLTRRRA